MRVKKKNFIFVIDIRKKISKRFITEFLTNNNLSPQIVGCLLAAVASGQQNDLYFRKPEQLVKSTNEVGDRLGNYAFAYETEGGILQREVGKRKYEGTDAETQLIQGSVQYNAPDGTPVAISWTADEYGTQVSGNVLPTPPPIPPEIQRALDWLAKQPSTTEPPEYQQPSRPTTTFRPPPAIVLKKQQFTNFNKQPFPAPVKRQQQPFLAKF